jgi:hypothetical protein
LFLDKRKCDNRYYVPGIHVASFPAYNYYDFELFQDFVSINRKMATLSTWIECLLRSNSSNYGIAYKKDLNNEIFKIDLNWLSEKIIKEIPADLYGEFASWKEKWTTKIKS